jgi:hypothetical protein
MPIGQVDLLALICIEHVRPAATGIPTSSAITNVAAICASRFIPSESIDPFRPGL